MEQYVWTIQNFNQKVLPECLDKKQIYSSPIFLCIEKKWQLILRGDTFQNDKCTTLSLWLHCLENKSVEAFFAFTLLEKSLLTKTGWSTVNVSFTFEDVGGCLNILKLDRVENKTPLFLLIIVAIHLPLVASCQTEWLRSQFNEPKHSDVIFVNKKNSQTLYAHRAILELSSSKWTELLPLNPSQKVIRVWIDEGDYKSFFFMLIYLYKGFSKFKQLFSSETWNVKTILPLYKISLFYNYDILHVWTCFLLQEIMNQSNVFEILETATKYQDSLIQQRCLNFISKETLIPTGKENEKRKKN